MGKQRETYQVFCEIIVNRIEEQFAQDAIVQVNTVVKNNEVVYDALNIIVEGEKIHRIFIYSNIMKVTKQEILSKRL